LKLSIRPNVVDSINKLVKTMWIIYLNLGNSCSI